MFWKVGSGHKKELIRKTGSLQYNVRGDLIFAILCVALVTVGWSRYHSLPTEEGQQSQLSSLVEYHAAGEPVSLARQQRHHLQQLTEQDNAGQKTRRTRQELDSFTNYL